MKIRLATIRELMGFLWKHNMWYLMPLVLILTIFALCVGFRTNIQNP